MIEVEVKAHAKDLKVVTQHLKTLGAVFIKEEHQEDLYFNAPHRDFAQTDEALRVRNVTDEEGKTTFITYKGAKMDQLSKTRVEVEVGVEDPVKSAIIFENLGFRPVATVKKDRTIYSFQDLIITLDRVDGAGDFVEIEKDMQEGTDYQEALDHIFAVYTQLRIDDGFERRSYLEILGIN
ncbi:MAG TPA: class IV adenylate cyclase [Methanobacteriaceae archaeon]|nr:class IV adenylate cyclase [Methanobacteriaceae archaeon]